MKKAATNLTLFFSYLLLCLDTFGQNSRVELVLQRNHSQRIVDVACSEDGKWIITGSMDRSIKIWDTHSGKIINTFATNLPSLRQVALSPNQRFLAASGDGIINLWDLESGKRFDFSDGKTTWTHQLMFSPDNRYLIVCGNNNLLTFWDMLGPLEQLKPMWLNNPYQRIEKAITHSEDTTGVDTYKMKTRDKWKMTMSTVSRVKFGSNLISDLVFAPNGKWLAAADGSGVNVYAYPELTFIMNLSVGTKSKIKSLAVSDNGYQLVGLGWKDEIFLWKSREFSAEYQHQIKHLSDDARNRQHLVKKYEIDEGANTICFTPEAFKLIVNPRNSRKAIFEFDLATGLSHKVAKWSKIKGRNVIQHRPTGSFILYNYFEKFPIRVSGHNLSKIQKFKQPDFPIHEDLFFIEKEHVLVSEFQNYLLELNLNNSSILISKHERFKKGIPSRIGTSPDGNWIVSASSNGELLVYERGFPKDKRTILAHPKVGKSGNWIGQIGFSPDGAMLATTARDNYTRLWSFPEMDSLHAFNLSWWGMTFAFSKNSRLFAYSDVRKVSVIDLKTHQSQQFQLTKKVKIESLLLTSSPDQLLIGYENGMIEKIQLKDSVRKIYPAHWGNVSVLLSSSDEQMIVSGGHDNAIYLWSKGEDKQRIKLSGHTAKINDLLFMPGDKILVSSSDDGTLRFWNTADGQLLATTVIKDQRQWITSDPDGYFDGTTSGFELVPMSIDSLPNQLFEPEQFFNVFYQPGLLKDVTSEARSINAMLKARGDPRHQRDITKLARSKLPEIHSMQALKKCSSYDMNVSITVKARDTGSGLRDLKLYRNGSLAYERKGELTTNLQDMYVTTVPVSLSSGPNEITARVFNRQDLRSKAFKLKVNCPRSYYKRRAYILSAGIENYASGNLRFATKDARYVMDSLSSYLIQGGDYSTVHSILLLDNQASKKNVMDTLTYLQKVIRPGDLLISFFSMHGLARSDRFHLVTYEAGQHLKPNLSTAQMNRFLQRCLTNEDLEAAFRSVNTSNILLIFDTCHSGQSMGNEHFRKGPMNARNFAQLIYDKGISVLAATQNNQNAYEFDILEHGLLTYVLINEGLASMRADVNPRDKKIDIHELIDYVVRATPNILNRTVAESKSGQRKGVEEVKISSSKKKKTQSRTLAPLAQTPKAYVRRDLPKTRKVYLKRVKK